jgi:hypothetical protein
MSENLMVGSHKSSNKDYRDNYDRIFNKLEHEESENCWCCPTVEEYTNGNKVIIHNEPN